MSIFDIAIIGAGPGGYVAAIRAAQLGKKVALIEKNELGGICLNHGCIPTKALIASAHILDAIKNAESFGIEAGPAKIDLGKAHARKDKVVSQLRQGITALLKGSGVEVLKGEAKFSASGKLEVDGATIDAKNILIATGSSWIEIPALKTDGKFIITSTEALNWQEVPKTLLIVGGGVIGCEFACMMNAFGAKVTIVEATPSILPPVEKAISRLLTRSMKSKGIEILTDTTATQTTVEGNEVKITLSSGETKIADKVMVAIGRRPLTKSLNLESAGIALTERGFIKVDDNFKTSVENIYAIGDVIGGNMLAHAASAEGIAAIEGIFAARHAPRAVRHAPCPSPIFTNPEIASVGATSEELESTGIKFKTGRFPYAASGKAICDGETEGQVLVHADDNGNILGVHIFGKDATTLIAEAALAMTNGLTAEAVASTIHAHPTLSEIFAEASEDVFGKAIHKLAARR
jgi:dihydrolipoamide dehydrogenase